jgi:isopropylmalate/homocitrate/citramalate synthase
MAVWKGGRGVKASYETTHVRVPLPVKEKVEAIIQAFKDGETETEETKLSEEEIIEIAKNILRQKKSAKISLETFLKNILNKEVLL